MRLNLKSFSGGMISVIYNTAFEEKNFGPTFKHRSGRLKIWVPLLPLEQAGLYALTAQWFLQDT